MRVVLDTNIIIFALEAQHKRDKASSVERACLEVIEAWKNDLFALGIHGILMEEYVFNGERKVREGKVNPADLSELMRRVEEKAHSHRVRASKVHITKSYKDDHLFDGLCGDYLVSEDEQVVRTSTAKTAYRKILRTEAFLLEIRGSHFHENHL